MAFQCPLFLLPCHLQGGSTEGEGVLWDAEAGGRQSCQAR